MDYIDFQAKVEEYGYAKVYGAATNEEWGRGLRLYTPEHMHGVVARYIMFGLYPGEFLHSLLSGDLFTAARHADDENRSSIMGYVQFFFNYAPAGCYRSKEHVDEWIKQGGLFPQRIVQSHADTN